MEDIKANRKQFKLTEDLIVMKGDEVLVNLDEYYFTYGNINFVIRNQVYPADCSTSQEIDLPLLDGSNLKLFADSPVGVISMNDCLHYLRSMLIRNMKAEYGISVLMNYKGKNCFGAANLISGYSSKDNLVFELRINIPSFLCVDEDKIWINTSYIKH